MKKKGITLALLLSCTTAAAAPALPSTNSDLRALEQNKAQTPQQADTVCATGKRTAHCLPRQYTVQFPELFQHRTGQCISPHCAFPHWRTV